MENDTNAVLSILNLIGIIDAAILAGAIIYAFILWGRGVFPALLRLGNGLAKRKVAVFASSDHTASLKSLLVDSELFRPKNIIEVTVPGDIRRAEYATVYLVHWSDWGDRIAQILDMKPDRCALIVYAPHGGPRIPEGTMERINSGRHATVVNFSGRLLNDLIVSMMSTGYKD